MSVTHGHVLASGRHDREAEVQNPVRASLGRGTHSYRQTSPVGVAHWGMAMGLLSDRMPARLTAATPRVAARHTAAAVACHKAAVAACHKAVVAACHRAVVVACHTMDWGMIGSAGCHGCVRCKAPGNPYNRLNNHLVLGHCCFRSSRSCGLIGWFFLEFPRYHSWSEQAAAFALRAAALICGFAIAGACRSKRCVWLAECHRMLG